MRGIVNFIYKMATGGKRIRTILTPIFAMLFLLGIILLIFIALKTDEFFQLSGPLYYPWSVIVSVPLIVMGVLLWGWSVMQFLRVGGTPVPINPPPRLVTTGPYAYTRNPMLSGVFLFLFGLGIILESPSLVLFYTPFFVVLNVVYFKFIEEPELERRLGDEYREYKRRTPMLIPHVLRNRKKGKI